MKIIRKCRYCNEDIVFLRSVNGKPEPVGAACLTLGDFAQLLEQGSLKFDCKRHVCHLEKCPAKTADLRAFEYMRRLASPSLSF